MSRRRSTRSEVIDVQLRAPHVHYLEYLAEQAGISVSSAFESILEKQAALALLAYKPPRKRRMSFSLNPKNAEVLDRLAVKAGLFKADIARRLIDEALANDRSLGG